MILDRTFVSPASRPGDVGGPPLEAGVMAENLLRDGHPKTSSGSRSEEVLIDLVIYFTMRKVRSSMLHDGNRRLGYG